MTPHNDCSFTEITAQKLLDNYKSPRMKKELILFYLELFGNSDL